MPDTMPNGGAWPKISIVTPSYQQGQFIEETIRSVLLQGYQNLEYIVIDGGSTDESVSIIRKYEPWLTHWVSEKDQGQSHAINKGFAKATGDILAWLNSDDFYLPSALARSVEMTPKHGLVLGDVWHVGEDSLPLRCMRLKDRAKATGTILENMMQKDFIFQQQGMFWSRTLHQELRGLNERLHYVMDLDFLLRAMALGIHPVLSGLATSCYRIQPQSKTCGLEPLFHREAASMYLELGSRPGFLKQACRKAALHDMYYFHRKTAQREFSRQQTGRGMFSVLRCVYYVRSVSQLAALLKAVMPAAAMK